MEAGGLIAGLMAGLMECVPNVAEGRDAAIIAALGRACGPMLLDVHSDPDHHRSVFTLAGSPPDVDAAVRSLARRCVEALDLGSHAGAHPRRGVLDVVPFVALDGGLAGVAQTAARAFAQWMGEELGVPTFLYDDADPGGRTLPEIRRTAFAGTAPDFGPGQPHPSAGATAVSARGVLVALNCNLHTEDLALADSIAQAVRERDGGLPGVRAMAFPLPTQDCVQVSMNLVDLKATGIEPACTAVREQAESAGARVVAVELVGLIPAAELERCSAEFRQWSGIDASATIEARLAAREAAY